MDRKASMRRLLGACLIVAAPESGALAQDGIYPVPFRLGMIVENGGEPVVEGLSAIKSSLSSAIGVPVEVFVARDYPALVQAQIDGRVDYAVYSAAAYAAASLRCGCVKAVVAPVDRNGAIGFRASLIVRTGQTGTPAAQPRIAVGPPDSLAGRLAPLAGMPTDRLAALKDSFVAAESLAAAEALFVEGGADGYFGWTLAWPDDVGAPQGGSVARLRAAGMTTSDFMVEWQSAPMRYGPHAVRADIDPEHLASLVAFMTGTGTGAGDLAAVLGRHHDGGFVAVSHDDYVPVIEAVAGLALVRP